MPLTMFPFVLHSSTTSFTSTGSGTDKGGWPQDTTIEKIEY